MKYLILAIVFFVPLIASENTPNLKPTIVYPQKKLPTRTWRSIDEEKTEVENLNPENTEVAVKSKAEEEAESFFSSIQTGLASLGAQIPSWKQLSKSAQNGITTVTKSAQNGIATVQRGLGVAFPYVLVLSLAALVTYVTFSAVSFAVATKTNLWNMGSNYLRENLPIFSTEQGDTSTFANRMMTDYLAPYIIPLIHNFPQMYEGEEDLE